MTKSPAFQFYPQDFLVGAADMSAEEVGVYIRLLCFQWTKGSIPSDVKVLSRPSGGRVKAVETVITKFVKGEDGTLRNERLERVREAQEDYRQKQATHARKRWGGTAKPAGSAMGSHVKPICQTDALHLQSSSSSSDNTPPTPSKSGTMSVMPTPSKGEGGRVWQQSPEQCIAACAMAGVPPDFIRTVWLEHDASGVWNDYLGNPIANIGSYMKSRWNKHQSRQAERRPALGKGVGAIMGKPISGADIPSAGEAR